MVNFLCQQIIHFQLLFDNILKLLHIGVNIKVNIPYSLNFGYELTLLRQEFGIFFDCCHMCCENFLLFFQNIGYLLLKSKVLLPNIVVFEGRLHYVHILFEFLFVNFVHFSHYFLFDFLLNMLLCLFLAVNANTFRVFLLLLALPSD